MNMVGRFWISSDTESQDTIDGTLALADAEMCITRVPVGVTIHLVFDAKREDGTAALLPAVEMDDGMRCISRDDGMAGRRN